jgi:hypothetical protein
LSEVKAKVRIIERLAQQFVDHRYPELIEHSVRELIGQRVLALALAHEDLNDHDRLCLDPLLVAALGKRDLTGAKRFREQDRARRWPARARSTAWSWPRWTPTTGRAPRRSRPTVPGSTR